MKAKIKNIKHLKGRGKKPQQVKITEERYPFIFERIARGATYETTAQEFQAEFNVKISLQGIADFCYKHPEQYKEFLDDIRQVRLANAKARILESQAKVEKLGAKIDDILENVPYSKWDRINISALIREFRGLLDQISQDCGDKVQKFKGEGFGDHKHFYFGDHAINRFADLTLEERQGEETANLRNRIKTS